MTSETSSLNVEEVVREIQITPLEFCAWLKGFLEYESSLTEAEVQQIREKLSTVFVHTA